MTESPDRAVHLLRQVLQYLQLVGFNIKGGGLYLSIGAAGISDMLALFFGGRSADTVDAITTTGDAIKAAVAYIESTVEKVIWQDFENNHLADLALATDEYKAAFRFLSFEAMKLKPGADPALAASWRRRMDDVKSQCEQDSPLLLLMHWVRLPGHAQSPHQILSIYLMAASMYLNYCQLAVMLEKVEAARDRDTERHAWKQRHPDGQAGDDDPEPPKLHIDLASLVNSPYCRLLTDQTDAVLAYAETAVKALDRDRDRLQQGVDERHDHFSLEEARAGRWRYKDSGSGFTSDAMDRDAAELAMELARGRAVTEVEERLTRQLGLEGVGDGSRQVVHEILHTLRTTRDTFPRHAVPLEPPETPESPA